MDVTERDRQLLAAVQKGLPLAARPYAELGKAIGMSEQEVIDRLGALKRAGIIRRHGVIVRHHELGYRSNAMSVWAVPEDQVDRIGRQVAGEPGITLCYRRRSCTQWPYNLYCMIHGRDRNEVLARRAHLAGKFELDRWPHAVLFSARRFKQRGAWYRTDNAQPMQAGAADG